jgi:hypothetical protein
MKRLRRPFEEEYLVEFGTGGSDFSMNGVVVHPLPEHWDEIVELYTDTNLTRPEDKLVAISGLAREVQKDKSTPLEADTPLKLTPRLNSTHPTSNHHNFFFN